MNQQTTPPAGPFGWEAARSADQTLKGVFIVDVNGRKVAGVYGAAAEREALANVFAAAPSLYEVVKAIRTSRSHAALFPDGGDLTRLADAALARAEGREP